MLIPERCKPLTAIARGGGRAGGDRIALAWLGGFGNLGCGRWLKWNLAFCEPFADILEVPCSVRDLGGYTSGPPSVFCRLLEAPLQPWAPGGAPPLVCPGGFVGQNLQ